MCDRDQFARVKTQGSSFCYQHIFSLCLHVRAARRRQCADFGGVLTRVDFRGKTSILTLS